MIPFGADKLRDLILQAEKLHNDLDEGLKESIGGATSPSRSNLRAARENIGFSVQLMTAVLSRHEAQLSQYLKKGVAV